MGTAPRAVARRPSRFARLIDHFHTHPQGRLHELLFWFGLGAAIGGFALWGWLAGWMSTAIALVLAVIAITLALWSLLPQHRPAKPPAAPVSPKSKRKQQR